MNGVIYKRRSDILSADMNGETVMMSLETNKFFNIGGIGGRIWALLEVPRTADRLTAELMEEYDVDAGRCAADVRSFLDSLEENGLIEREELSGQDNFS